MAQQGHSVDEYLETIYFLAFPIGEYRPHSSGSPTLASRAAEMLGDTFTDDMVERIEERLGNPERCPHGWPVDPAVEQAENNELAPLSDIAAGTRATIVRLAEHDGELLHWFYDQGLVPGRELVVRDAEPAADQFTIAIDGGERAISEKAAAGLFVRLAA